MNLYKINDMINDNFIRLPLAIIANPKYRRLSSDARILYALLCNRLKLSQINNWVNDKGEVYLIYTREQAAEVIGVSYKTAIKTFKELIDAELLFEERRGKSLANHLYLSKPEECKIEQAIGFNEVFDKPFKNEASENLPPNEVICKNDISKDTETACESSIPTSDMSDLHIKTCKKCTSRTVKSTVQDVSNLQAKKKEFINKNLSHKEISQSFNQSGDCNSDADGQTLQMILDNCEFEIFNEDISRIYKSAIERLYYSDYYVLGNAKLPRDRAKLSFGD